MSKPIGFIVDKYMNINSYFRSFYPKFIQTFFGISVILDPTKNCHGRGIRRKRAPSSVVENLYEHTEGVSSLAL